MMKWSPCIVIIIKLYVFGVGVVVDWRSVLLQQLLEGWRLVFAPQFG